MTDLYTLARDAMALPGFHPHPAMAWRVFCDGIEYTAHAYRGLTPPVYQGMAPYDLDWRITGRVLDLSDDATGGVLLSLLDCDVTVSRNRRESGWIWRAVWFGENADGRSHHIETGATLAEVCCRVAVARGRWA